MKKRLSKSKQNSIIREMDNNYNPNVRIYLNEIEGKLYSTLFKVYEKGMSFKQAKPMLLILYKQLGDELLLQANKDIKEVGNSLKETMRDSYDSTSKLLDNDKPLSNRAIKKRLEFPWSGATYRTRILTHVDTLFKQIQLIIQKDLQKEKNFLKVVDKLSERFNIYNRQLDRLVKTETQHFIYEGAKATYKDKRVKKVQWITVSDDLTCPACASLDQQVFNINDTPPLPQHPKCRCSLVPYEI